MQLMLKSRDLICMCSMGSSLSYIAITEIKTADIGGGGGGGGGGGTWILAYELTITTNQGIYSILMVKDLYQLG